MNLNRFVNAWREYGTVGLVWRTLRKKSPIQFSHVYCKSNAVISRSSPELTVERLRSLDLVDGATLNAIQSSVGAENWSRMACLFESGCELWIGRVEGSVAGLCWSRGNKERHNYFVSLNESDATILSCIVPQAFRARGIYTAMLQHMVRELIEQNQIKNVFIDCATWNTPSIRGIRSAGFQHLGNAARVVLFNSKWIVWNQCKHRQLPSIRASGDNRKMFDSVHSVATAQTKAT